MDVESTPDVIVSAEKKKQIYDQYVNPKIARTKKEERRALAVAFPGWEPRGAMVFDADNWDRAVHVINPLWDDNDTPKGLTLWRSQDYGSARGTNVCLWFAVGPLRLLLARKPDLLELVPPERRGEIFGVLYRTLYETGLEIADMVREVIERSHNTREDDGEIHDDASGNTYRYWREIYGAESYWGGSLLDPRSSAQKQQGQSLREIFSRYGENDVRPASGDKDMIQIPRLKDWMTIDWKKPHPFRRNTDGTPMMGCPRLFFFDGRTSAVQAEIEGLRKPDDQQQARSPTQFINKDDPHHAVDAAKYWASDNPRSMSDVDDEDRDETAKTPAVNAYTGY